MDGRVGLYRQILVVDAVAHFLVGLLIDWLVSFSERYLGLGLRIIWQKMTHGRKKGRIQSQ